MKEIWTILTVSLMLLLLGCGATTEPKAKINGVSFVASNDLIDASHTETLIKLHANYASIMPFGFIQNLEHPEIVFNTDRQWYGETTAGVKQYVKILHDQDIAILLKPQLWVWRGEFTGFIEMSNDDDWQVLENSYTAFILEYARLAQELQVEMFCIGTELERFIEARPEYWRSLIDHLKQVYHGQLTYAANWNEYQKTPFWDQLDYIGIDAYFPIDSKRSPTLDAAKSGWKNYKMQIKAHATKFKKQILFTEFGYRSIDFAGRAPWTVDKIDKQVNLEAQQILTQALFEEFWDENWFAGGFVWKWFHDHKMVGGKDDNRFTPQNKPAENVILEYYKKYAL